MAKRRLFISYHHHGDQDIVDQFITSFSDRYDVFTDMSLDRAADSDNSDYLNQVCRDAIDGTSVTMVMVGWHTGERKFVDWEIRYTLHRPHGLFAISRPGLSDAYASVPARVLDNIRTGYAKWYNYPTSPDALSQMIETAYYANALLIDNTREKRSRNG